MLSKEMLDILGLMRRKVVENHVNFLGPFGAFHQAVQKGDDLLRSMPLRGHAVYLRQS